VVSDRYVYSSLAYQGAAGIDLNWIEEINRHAIRPDLAIYLDVPPEVAVKRIKRRRSVMETLQTQQRVRDFYVRLVENGQLIVVNGNKPIGEVARDILALTLDFLKN